MKSITKSILKSFLIFFITLNVLALVVFIFIQTPWFNSLLRSYLIRVSNDFIYGELDISQINGNILREFSLNNIKIVDGGEQVLYIESIVINYDFIKVLRNNVFINFIEIRSPYLNILRNEDKTNSLQNIFKQTNENQSNYKEENYLLPFRLEIEKFSVLSGNLSFELKEENKSFFHKISDFYLNSKIQIHNHNLSVKLIDLHCTYNDAYSLDKLRFDLSREYDLIEVKNFILKGLQNTIQLSLQSKKELDEIKLNLYTEVIDFQDINSIFNLDISEKVNPEITVYLDYASKNFEVDIYIKSEEGLITTRINFPDFIFSDFYHKNFDFDIKTEIENLSVNNLIDHDFFKNTSINGMIEFSGNSYLFEEDFELNVVFYDFLVDQVAVDTFVFNLKQKSGECKSLVQIHSGAGEFFSGIRFNDLLEPKNITATVEMRNLNLYEMNLLEEETNINSKLEISASELNYIDSSFEFNIFMDESTLYSIQIDSLMIVGSYNNEIINFDQFFVHSYDSVLELHGYVSLAEEANLIYNLELNNADLLKTVYEEIDIDFTAIVQGKIVGETESFIGETSIIIQNIEYNDILIDTIYSDILFTSVNDTFNVHAETVFDRIIYDDLLFDRLCLIKTFASNQLDLKATLDWEGENYLFTELDICLSKSITAKMSKLEIKINNQIWSNSDGIEFSQLDNSFKIDNFNLSSSDQSIYLQGYYQQQDSYRILFELKNFCLEPLNYYTEIPYSLAGKINLFIDAESIDEKPLIHSSLNWIDPKFDDIILENVKYEIIYKNDLMVGNSRIIKSENQNFDIEFVLPLTIDLLGEVEILKEQDFYVKINVDELDVTEFDHLISYLDIKEGYLTFQLNLGNTLSDPIIDGYLILNEGNMLINQLGVNYSDIAVDIRLFDNKISVNNIYIKNNNGDLRIDGFVKIDPDNQNIADFDLDFNLFRFTLVNTRALSAAANSYINLKGNFERPEFSGYVNLVQSRVNLDELLKDTASSFDKPLLSQFMETTDEEVVIKTREQLINLDRLMGHLEVVIPRNTWIRGSDVNIELIGDLLIQKTAPYFEIFGEINILRGYYEFYGKRFIFQKGDVYFSGGRELNPAFDIEAVYRFRGSDRTRNNLTLVLRGDIELPEISFLLNNSPISEPDAVSYIFFGRRFDELTQGEKSEVTNHVALIGGVLVNRLSEELTGYISEKFHLDLFEFTGDAAAAQVGLEVGRYFTDRLFMSYRKDFNLKQSNEPVQEEIRLEYQILRNLFFQANKSNNKDTGFDFILKIER